MGYAIAEVQRCYTPIDIHTIVQSLTRNQERSAFCLFPCEPNLIYPRCNFRGMATLAVYDSLYGTNHIGRVGARWLQQLRPEFKHASRRIIGFPLVLPL